LASGAGLFGNLVGVVLNSELVKLEHVQMQIVEPVVLVLDQRLYQPGKELSVSDASYPRELVQKVLCWISLVC